LNSFIQNLLEKRAKELLLSKTETKGKELHNESTGQKTDWCYRSRSLRQRNQSSCRNALIAQSSDALIAVNGEYGTLSKIAFGLKMGKPVIVLGSKWEIEGSHRANSPEEAVELAFRLIQENEMN
jgi:hypothetical protein